MKKIVVLSLFHFCYALTAQGQSGPGFWAGVNGAVGGSDFLPANILLSKSRMVKMKSEIKPVYSGSVEAGYMFNKNIGMFIGAGISKNSFTLNMEQPPNYGAEGRIDGTTTYLELPIGLRYLFFQHKGYVFFANVGAKAATLWKDKTEYNFKNPYYGQSFRGTDEAEKEGGGVYQNFSLFPFIHLGINIPVGQFNFNIGPEVSYQVTNLYREAYLPLEVKNNIFMTFYDAGDWKAHYFNASLKINISLNF